MCVYVCMGMHYYVIFRCYEVSRSFAATFESVVSRCVASQTCVVARDVSGFSVVYLVCTIEANS